MKLGIVRWLVAAAVITNPGSAMAAPPDQGLKITLRLEGREIAKPDIVFGHPGDDNHRCILPTRERARLGPGPAPLPSEPPNLVTPYRVVFGPDPAALAEGGSTIPIGSGPIGSGMGEPPVANPTVRYFSLTIDPLPNQERGTGKIRLSLSFSLHMAAFGAWKGRFDESDRQTSGTYALDRDGRGGKFRLAHVEPDFAHGRAADFLHIIVSGTWRCPAM